MASITPTKNGYRVQIYVKGKRDSRVFSSKREATLWAERRTLEMRAEKQGTLGSIKTLADALRKYADEVSPLHKGEKWERVRLSAFESSLPVTLPLASVTAAHLKAWKAQRLQTVSAGSVLREMSLLSSVFTHARREWAWISDSPLADVSRPSQPRHRERIITRQETRIMLRALNHRQGRAQSMQQLAAIAFLLALRTGMRAGEIVGMAWGNYHGKWVTLPDTKNGTSRDVPLSRKASMLIERLRGLDDERVLPIAGQTLDALFRRARDKAGLSGFTFHDARHTAATRIGATVGQPGRLSFPEFCKCFGWRDPKYALVYCNPSAASLSAKL